MQPQLLDLFDKTYSFDNFISINNDIVIQLLKKYTSQFIHIVGARHSGKTHLLNAWVSNAPGTSYYMNYTSKDQSIRELANQYTYIAIDNVDHLNDEQQIELFDLFNKIKLNNLPNQLLTSSSTNLESVARLRIDLKTRLLSGINQSLKALNDNELFEAIDLFTANEGIKLQLAEKSYLINHYTRSIGVLIETIHKLAEMAVLEKRNITIPFIKQILLNK